MAVDITLHLQLEVFAESEMMIPDCERKLAVAWDDLTKLMVHR